MTSDLPDPFEGPDSAIGKACLELFQNNQNITFRAVAERIGKVHTTLMRNAMSKSQVEACKKLQNTATKIAKQDAKRSKAISDLEVAKLKAQLNELRCP